MIHREDVIEAIKHDFDQQVPKYDIMVYKYSNDSTLQLDPNNHDGDWIKVEDVVKFFENYK